MGRKNGRKFTSFNPNNEPPIRNSGTTERQNIGDPSGSTGYRSGSTGHPSSSTGHRGGATGSTEHPRGPTTSAGHPSASNRSTGHPGVATRSSKEHTGTSRKETQNPRPPANRTHARNQWKNGSKNPDPYSRTRVPQPLSPQTEKSSNPSLSQWSTPSTSSSTSHHAPQSSTMNVENIPKPSSDLQIVSTLKPGVEGYVIKVASNHLELNLGSLKNVYHYHITFLPEKKLKGNLRDVYEKFRLKHFPNRCPAFDGKSIIYAASPLSGNLNETIHDQIVIGNERPMTVNVEMKYVQLVDLSPLRTFFSGDPSPRSVLQCVDVILRSAPARICMPLGRSFFLPNQGTNIDQCIEILNGFFQSTVRGETKPLLNVDITHKTFIKAIPVTDALIEVLNVNFKFPFRREDLSRELHQKNKNIFDSFITDLKITYQIPNDPRTKRVYTVNGTGSKASVYKFEHAGKTLTMEEYFKNHKRYIIRYPHLPTLWVGDKHRKDKVLLPLELCTINSGQTADSKISPRQTAKMITNTATNTTGRQKKIKDALALVNYNANECVVNEFGFSVGNEFQEFDARILNSPSVKYANNTKVPTARGQWSIRNEKFLGPVTINNWTIAFISDGRNTPRMDDLIKLSKMLRSQGEKQGIIFVNHAVQPFNEIKIFNSNTAKDTLKNHFENKNFKSFDIIFIIVPDGGSYYSNVKSAAELHVGCLTQCIRMRTLDYKTLNASTVGNILLKVNSKLNGKNHCLASKPEVMKEPIMIMGADVTHPSPQAKFIPSVAAVTASHDIDGFQYNISCRFQPPRTEIIQDLETIVMEQLKMYYEKVKSYPKAIVFYRDGVSEGDYETVRREEIAKIKAACKRVMNDMPQPKITFLVVLKRHHTRLFPLDLKDSEDKNGNVPAGTCVDTVITNPGNFFLVSHASIKGVARPTKYSILLDENNMNSDQIQMLTYYLCYMYSRCNRAVSYPAPTYYAHLAAARVKTYIVTQKFDVQNLQEEAKKYQILDTLRKKRPMFFV